LKVDTAAQLFRALGDRTRLRILHLLLGGELTGTQIADALRVPRGRVARHLRYLYRSWLVTTRHQSNRTYYVLRPSEYPLHEAVREQILPVLKTIEGVQKDARRVKRS